MTGKDLLQALDYLDEEMLEQVHIHKHTFTKTAIKWVAAAAAAALFFGGGVAYAAKYGIIRTNPGWESGYRVDITSRRVTEEEFSEEVRAVKQELLADIETYKDRENQNVFGWIQDFDTVEASLEFIGHAGMKLPIFPGILEQTGVVVLGNNNADIMYTQAFARYKYDNHTWANVNCCAYTENYTYTTGGGIKDDGRQYADELYITANGKEAFLVYPAETEYAGNRFIEAYLVDDSVIYEISVSCFEHNQEDISQLVKNWLDQL